MDALSVSDIKFERHTAHFPRGEDDNVWLPFVAERSWVVVTKDKRNRYNDLEREAIRRSRVREFYFGGGNFTGAEMAKALVIAVPAMRKLCRTFNPPLVASITRSGIITVVYDEKGSTHDRRQKSRSLFTF
jgi:hypothetical protein